jgi:hypothetical protein
MAGQTPKTAKTEKSTLGIVGLISAVIGFWAIGIVLGPVAVVLGWLAMGRSWRGSKPITAVGAVLLGALDTVVSVLWAMQ